MFYSQFILAKKGPLGTIWIAAHLERKLRKNQVADTDIGVSVDSILFPEVPIALRLSSHLLLGVVRIYSRKVNYLFDDCSEALLKIKQAFRSTAVDLPPEESTAPYHSITLPETFDLDDFELPDNDIFQGNYVDHHVSAREQITLQDSREGAVYSTSQFGLDERFGDGDASQIGLDLEEDLLLEKASTFEHDGILETNPQESMHFDRLLDENEKKEEVTETLDGVKVKVSGTKIDGASSGIEAGEYAQGPSTPGLEEPNLAQVINEADYHNSSDFVSMKITQVSTVQEDVSIDHSMQDNVKNGSVLDFHREEMDCLLGDCERGNGPSFVPEYTDGPISASAVPEKVEDLHDGVVINNDPVVSFLDQTVNDAVSRGVNVSETVTSPNCSHVTSDQEDLSCKLLSHSDVLKGSEPDGHLKDKHALSKHETLIDIEMTNSEGESAPVGDAEASSAVHLLVSPGRPEVVDVEAQASQELKEAEALSHVAHEAVQSDALHLRPCTSRRDQTDVSSIGGDWQTTEQSGCIEIHQDLEKSDEQHGSQVLSDDQVRSDSKSVASDLPAPEKMLSLAFQHSVGPNNLPMESTPDFRDMAGGIMSVEGVKCVSGKKRSFTESTQTMQSVDLAESYEGTQSKRSAEFLPDDDDLLSSILVGRRSSFLKVKPTPAASEVVSIKRPCLAPRSSALKRKVLTDDTMVLHGDIIRQQLTNTEDIRRTRKKAPCTHQEILMIQRQFLEDEIFLEPIFKGVSTDLLLLRNEKFDLSGIKVCDHISDSSLSEATNDESFLRTNGTEIRGVESNIEPVVAQDVEEQPTGTPVAPESNQSEFNVESLDINVHGNTDAITDMKDIEISQIAKMNCGRENIGVFYSENCSMDPEIEPSSHADSVFDNNSSMPDDFAAPLAAMDKSNDFDGSMHTGMLGISSSPNLHPLPILEHELVDGKINRIGVGTSEISGDRVDIGTEVQINGDGSETVNSLYPSLATGCERVGEYTNNQASLNRDLHLEESGKDLQGVINEDQVLASGSGYDDKDSRLGCSYNEDTRVGYLHGGVVLDAKETSLIDQETSVSHEAARRITMHPESSAVESPLVDQNYENIIVTEDTGFLNVDDDMAQDDDDYIPCDEGAHLENSGWSSRTRAVAKYLQALFDKEDVHGRKNLPLDNLIAGKTRKEASRMFFETLVLKTRDYVHVEQMKPFANINIKPQSKLMKSEF